MMDQTQLRKLLIQQLTGDHAHAGFSRAVEGLTLEDVGTTPEGMPHTIWELVEHIRIAQFDILEFSRNPDYTSPNWPNDYWPVSRKPAGQDSWKKSVKMVQDDHQAMVELIRNPDNDLLSPIPHGQGQTLFREALLILDHNAYHIGQIVQVRRALGNW